MDQKRRIVGDELPYPDRVIKRVNQWGKTPRGEKYVDSIEFRNHERRMAGVPVLSSWPTCSHAMLKHHLIPIMSRIKLGYL